MTLIELVNALQAQEHKRAMSRRSFTRRKPTPMMGRSNPVRKMKRKHMKERTTKEALKKESTHRALIINKEITLKTLLVEAKCEV